MIDFFYFLSLRISQVIIVCSLLFLFACSMIDSHPPEQSTTTNENDQLQIEAQVPKVGNRFQQKTSTLEGQSLISHSPIYCSENGEYPGKLPQISLSFYEASVRDVLAEISLLIDFPIVVDEFVDGVVTIETKNISLDKALDLISASSNLSYRFFDDYILVGVNIVDTPSWASLSITCRFWPQYVSAERLFNSLGEIEKEFVFYPKGSDYLSISAPPGIQKKNTRKSFGI